MIMIMKNVIAPLLFLLVFYEHATSLIIPEELPTILSLIYSNIPPIKKGTDSRLGVGFRLGEHADFQILIELGPQTETEPIGLSNNAKKRRDAMLNAAMKGELGPFAQAMAKYQMERQIQKEIDKLKAAEKKIKKIQTEPENKPGNNDTVASNWLTKWRKEALQLPADRASLNPAQNDKTDDKIIQQRVEQSLNKFNISMDKLEELIKLYKLQNIDKKDTSSEKSI